jgi:methyl-accepting chemotaxis protein
VDDFTFGERIINYTRWPLILVLLLFNNLGFTPDRAFVWPINVGLLLALGMTAYVQYHLHQGHSFGKRATLALSVVQDALITAGVGLTGFYESHFYIFYYPSLLGFSLAFGLRTSLLYTTAVGGAYVVLSFLGGTGQGTALSLAADPEAFKILIERWLVLYMIVVIGSFLVRQERARREEAVHAEKQLARENERLLHTLSERMENWQQASQEVDHAANRSTELSNSLGHLAEEMESHADEIETAVQELSERSFTYIDQVEAIARMTETVVRSAHELAQNATPTGTSLSRAHQAAARADEAIRSLKDRSAGMGELAAAVRQVADQTHLLAFNANIEAIQAGDRGQRFAAVANEVRLVAERAVRLAREIDEMSQEVQLSTRQILNAMDEIGQMMDRTLSLVQVTSSTSKSQQDSADTMAGSVNMLLGMAQQNASDVQAIVSYVQRQGAVLQQVSAVGQELAESGGQLCTLTSKLQA